jgi:hypothetical protein
MKGLVLPIWPSRLWGTITMMRELASPSKTYAYTQSIDVILEVSGSRCRKDPLWEIDNGSNDNSSNYFNW